MAKTSSKINKRTALIAAFLVAVLFWFIINVVENPESTRIVNGVTLYLNTSGTMVDEQGLSIINFDNDETTVGVKISGASYIVNSVTPDDIIVTPSFDGVNASGKYSLKLNAVNNSTKKFDIDGVSPENVNVEFDYIDTASYDVKIKVKNARPEDGLVLGPERFTNSEKATLEVSGPRSIVSTISSVVAVAKADKNKKLSATESLEAKIKIYDADNKEIKTDNLTLNFTSISVSIPVYKTAVVPVKCTFTNKPKDYSPVASLALDGSTATTLEIEGAPDIIDETKFVNLEPIDFSEIMPKNGKFNKKLALPSGVWSVAGVTSADVSVDVSSLKSKNFKISQISVINNDNQYNVSLTKKISAVICGDKSVINSLTSSQLYAEIDLDGKSEGEQTVTVKIKSSKKDNIWQLGTCEAKVVIAK